MGSYPTGERGIVWLQTPDFREILNAYTVLFQYFPI